MHYIIYISILLIAITAYMAGKSYKGSIGHVWLIATVFNIFAVAYWIWSTEASLRQCLGL